MATPVLNDSALVAADPTYISRVKEALAQTCNSIASEAITGAAGTMPLQLHILRARLASSILNNLNAGTPNWAQTFALAVATDPASIAAATAAGTLTSATAAAGAAAITDTQILNAVSAMFNNFLTLA